MNLLEACEEMKSNGVAWLIEYFELIENIAVRSQWDENLRIMLWKLQTHYAFHNQMIASVVQKEYQIGEALSTFAGYLYLHQTFFYCP